MLSNGNQNLVVVGDWNGRVTDVKNLPTYMELSNDLLKQNCCSKDNVLNSKGQKVIELCESSNFLLLNSRFNRDYTGEYTFFNSVGESMVDLCCVSLDCVEFISLF